MANVDACNAGFGGAVAKLLFCPIAQERDYLGFFSSHPVQKHPIQKTADVFLQLFEQSLNHIGYVPGVSLFTGSTRVVCGFIEVIGAVAAGAFLGLYSFASYDGEQRSEKVSYALAVMANYSMHGLANIFRGSVEVIPYVGNLSCLLYDLRGLRFRYPFEHVDRITPIFMRTI